MNSKLTEIRGLCLLRRVGSIGVEDQRDHVCLRYVKGGMCPMMKEEMGGGGGYKRERGW